VITDKLLSYGAAFHRIGLACHHEHELRKNDRAENSQQETPRAVSECQVLRVKCVLALPLGEMAHVVAPLCHS
jgi:transposase-like protein